jgi:hypothetical protein
MILNIYKTYKIGKRIIIEGYIILLRASILGEVKKAEEANVVVGEAVRP